MNAKDYIIHETERQSGTMREAVGMYSAWQYARDMYIKGEKVPVEVDMLVLVQLIGTAYHYRQVPAVFNQGMPAVEASLVPRAMQRLFESIATPADADINDLANLHTKEFLEIHPFTDGNGRVGSLLWNWLRGTLSSPEPMPYFFGDK